MDIPGMIYYQVVLLFSCFMQGITGFGFAVIAAPLLLLSFAPEPLVISFIIISLVLNGFLYITLDAGLAKKDLLFLAVGAVIGTPLGYLVLNLVDADTLKLVAGVSTLLFLFMMALKEIRISATPVKTSVVGLIVGALQTSIGVSGPPLVLYFSSRDIDPKVLRRTYAAIFFIISLTTVPLIFTDFSGNLPHLYLGFSALPVVIIGSWLGKKISPKVNGTLLKTLIFVLVFISAAGLISNSIG